MRPGILSLAFVIGFLTATAAAQTNDNFAGRLTLSGSRATAVSNNLQTTRESGEPNHAASAAGRSLWWTWTAPTSGVVNFSTFSGAAGSTILRTIAVYTGDSLNSLTEVGSNNGASTNAAAGAALNLSVTQGAVYQIAVDNSTKYSIFNDNDGTVVLSINAPPTIVSAAGVNAYAGQSFQYGIMASNGPTAYDATNLPPGLSVNPVTGKITGPSPAKGIYSIGISATGPGGTGSATLTVHVVDPVVATPATPAAPVITGSAAANGYVGAAFTYSLDATDSPTGYTAGNLPVGLTLDASTGVISGAPTEAGAFVVPLTATNSAGTGSATVAINVAAMPPAPVISSALAAKGTAGSAFSYSIATIFDGTAGAIPTGYAAGGLPPGLSLSAAGKITGTPTQAGVYPVALSVTNAGGTRSGVVTITVADAVAVVPATAPPVLSSAASASGVVGTAFTYRLSASGTPTSYSASNLPAGLSFNAPLGTISGTPTAAGTFLVPVAAANAYGACSTTLTLNVAADATAQAAVTGYVLPLITSAAAVNGYTGRTLSYTLAASYNDSSYTSGPDTWSFGATGLPPGLSLGAATYYGTATITGTPTTAGTYPVNIRVTYPASTFSPVHPALTNTGVVTFIIKAGPVPVPPVLAGAAGASAVVGAAFSYSPGAANSPTGFAASGLPPGLSINAATGAITGTPTTAGTYQGAITATNSAGAGSAIVTFVVAPRAVPLITSAAATSGTMGTTFSFPVVAATGVTGYGATNLPPGLSINATTGLISGTPTAAGAYAVPLSVANAAGAGTATMTITIVAPANLKIPFVTSPAVRQGAVGSSFNYGVSASASVASYTASNLPPGLALDASSGAISGTPTVAGTYLTPINSTNAAGTGSVTMTFLIAPQPAPVLTSSVIVYSAVNASFYYGIFASNAATRFAASNLPPGITFSASSGVMSGRPTAAGIYSVPVSASNASGTTSATLTINVSAEGYLNGAPNLPFIVNGAAAAGVVGSAFSYQFAASNSPTSFSLSSTPPGMTFNAATGYLAGTPTAAGTYGLTVSASNALGTRQANFSLVVVASAASRPPVISGLAAVDGVVRFPFTYYFNVTGSYSAISVSSLPAGLSYNATTRAITGTPTTAGTFVIPATVTNSSGLSSNASLTFTIAAAPLSPPTFTTGNPLGYSYVVGDLNGTITLSATNYPETYAASGLPPGMSVDAASGVISGSPTNAGTYAVTISASNAAGSTSAVTTFVVAPASLAQPVFTSLAASDATGYPGVSFNPKYVSASNNPTNFSAVGLPPGLQLTVNSGEGYVSGTPTAAGVYPVTLSATTAAGGTGSAVWTVIINDPTTLRPAFVGTTTAAAAGRVGQSLTYYFRADTAASDNNLVSLPITYSIGGLPPGLVANTNGDFYPYLSGIPTAAGVYPVAISATSSGGVTTSAVVTLVIADALPPLVASAANVSGNVGAPLSYTLSANASVTNYAASGLPPGLGLNAATGAIAGTPTASGVYAANISATGSAGVGSAVVTFLIAPPAFDGLPVISSAASLDYQDGRSNNYYPTSEGSLLYSITAINGPTSFGAANLPPGLSFNPVTGVISGQPLTAGIFRVPISATNSAGTIDATLTITVTAPFPAITSALAASGRVGIPFSFTLRTAANPNGTYNSSFDPLTFTASGLPPGLSLNTASGFISGTPTQAGTYAVAVSARNHAGSSRAAFNVAVTAAVPGVAVAPSFSSKAMVWGFVGLPLSHTLSAAGTTSFTATGLPAGLNLNPANGRIDGTPGAAGIFPVQVSASNSVGTVQAVLTIAVDAVPPISPLSSDAGAAARIGSPFSYSVSVASSFSDIPAVTARSVGSLPAGLSFNAQNGFISGTPTGPVGAYQIPISAAVGSASSVGTLTLLIVPAAPAPSPTAAALSSPAGVLGFLSNPMNYSLGSALFSPVSALPPGLAFDSVTGRIAGYPVELGSRQVSFSAPGVTTDDESSAAVLTFDAVMPDLSLPRLISQPVSVAALLNGSASFSVGAQGVPPPEYQWAHDGAPIPGATSATLSLSLVQPTDAGYYTVTVSNSSGQAVSQAAALLIYQSYAAWQSAHFSDAEIAAGMAADTADYNGDGVVNLLEYALGIDPRSGAGGSLPTVACSSAEGALQLTFTRDPAKTDLEYVVEATPDLNQWTPIAHSAAGAPTANLGGASSVVESAGAGGQVNVTVKSSPSSVATKRGFLRLRVVRR